MTGDLTEAKPSAAGRHLVETGVAGLDDILGGGLAPGRLYLVEGMPGTGKTTLSLQFLLRGKAEGQRSLYVTLSETAEELRAAAASHGWSLDGIELYELVNTAGLDLESEQTILHPSEFELGETVKEVMQRVDQSKSTHVVFDSLSELRALAQNPLRYRRQILALKQFFAQRKCTVLMLDDRTSSQADLQLHSIAHGVISLEQTPRDFGTERRRVRIIKMRGTKFRGGFHDFVLDTGGLIVFPRLVAAEHHSDFDPTPVSTGLDTLNKLLGGGLVPGTNFLFIGPAGVGKTTTAISCVLPALAGGRKVAYYLFDEGISTLLSRSASLGMDVRKHIETGALAIRQIDPAELAPGEFSAAVRTAIEDQDVKVVVIDSLNAYLHAMPGERHLILQMHELLTYLNQRGILTIMILGQHGILGEVRSDVDLSYLSDGILLFRFFESKGEVRIALSAVKSRVNAHERSIRELKLTADGLRVGEALTDFDGILTGLPSYRGSIGMITGQLSAEDQE